MIKKIFFLLLLTTAIIKADSTYVYPALFYTNGDYSNTRSSNSFAFYTTIFKDNVVQSFSYEKILLNDPLWEYDEDFFTIGLGYYFGKSFIKLNYGNLNGLYESKDSIVNNTGQGPGQGNRNNAAYSYKDKNNIFNLDYIFYDYFNYGFSYAYQNQTGSLIQNVNQVTLRFERIFNYNFFASLRPSLSVLSDNRKLFSASLRLHYLLFPELLLKAGGFIGERAYYFDPDLLVIYNQDETQKYQLWAQIDYYLFNRFTLSLAYQHTKFSSGRFSPEPYKINYLVAGIRTWFMF